MSGVTQYLWGPVGDMEIPLRRLLLRPCAGLKPQHKYLLMVYLHVYGFNRYARDGYQKLALVLGYPQESLRRRLDVLVKEGYFESPSREVRGVGRPPKTYVLSQYLRKELLSESLRLGSGQHSRILHRVLALDGTGVAKRRILKLGESPRLLLAYLIERSDLCGTVRGVGVSEIVKALGVGRKTVLDYLDMLKGDGYIRSVVGGVVERTVFKQVAGAFFLNLKHPAFSVCGDSGCTWSVDQGGDEDPDLTESYYIYDLMYSFQKSNRDYWRNGQMHLNALVRHAERVRRSAPWITSVESLELALPLLDVDPSPLPKRYLQLKIDEYASQLLNGAFDARGNCSPGSTSILRERIKNELSHSHKARAHSDEHREYIRALELKSLSLLLCEAARHLASICWTHLWSHRGDVPLSEMCFVIVSSASNGDLRSEIGIDGFFTNRGREASFGNRVFNVPEWSIVYVANS